MTRLFSGVLMPVTIGLLTAAALFAARGILIRLLQRWARDRETNAGDIIVGSVKMPSLFWIAAIGIYVGVAVSDLPQRYVQYFSATIHVLVILSITIAAANLSGRLFAYYLQKADLPFRTTGLAYGVMKGAIYVTGFLIILTVLGISITPLITALGVGGLAVALALQDTLANLFAGMHILVEKSIRVGDFIRLESGQEGYVDDITWRTTRVRMLPNNMVIIPNSKLSQSIVTNYHLPERRMALLTPVSVSYAADPEHVERVLLEEAKQAAAELPGMLSDPEPFVRFIPGFGDSSLDFTLICQVKEFTDQYPTQHELRKRIFRRFKQEGIEIPFPHRTVYFREEKDWKK